MKIATIIMITNVMILMDQITVVKTVIDSDFVYTSMKRRRGEISMPSNVKRKLRNILQKIIWQNVNKTSPDTEGKYLCILEIPDFRREIDILYYRNGKWLDIDMLWVLDNFAEEREEGYSHIYDMTDNVISWKRISGPCMKGFKITEEWYHK